MSQTGKTAITLLVLSVLLAGGVWWGWSAVSEPFPEVKPPPECLPTEFAAGDTLTTGDVAVSVFNAGKRAGLAQLTLQKLGDRGFGMADQGNAPTEIDVNKIVVLAEDRSEPAVRLLMSHLPKGTKVVAPPDGDPIGEGVVVVVGDGFEDLNAAKASKARIKLKQAATVCVPIAESETPAA